MIEHYGKDTARFDEIQNFLTKIIDVILVTYKDNIQKAIKKLSKRIVVADTLYMMGMTSDI